MTSVFLDTVGIIALFDEDDQWHDAAAVAYEQVRAAGAATVTTPQVMLECGNAASRRPYRAAIAELRQKLLKLGRLIEPSGDEIEAAWITFSNDSPGQAGIVDQISFVVMRRLGITQAFTNDRHFTNAGFVALF